MAHAAGWVVNALTDAANGNCTTMCTLRDAMSLAASGDTITFSVSGTITLGSTLPAVRKTLTIDGTGQSVTISGNNTFEIMYISRNFSLSLNALTLSNATGHAIWNELGTLNVTNSTFTNNSDPIVDGDGGAIFNDGGTLNAANDIFSGNSAPSGFGGAIFNNSGLFNIANVVNSTFYNNSAPNGPFVGDGGAIFNNGGPLNITGSTFVDNSAGIGGAIDGGPLNITNSTFAGNSALTGNGGAIADLGPYGPLNITNSTFAGNSAPTGNGGGIANTGSGSVTLNNSILTNSIGSDCSGGSFSSANDLSDGTCGVAAKAVTNIAATLASNGGPTQTFALLSGSNAIDAVPDNACVYVSTGTNPLFTNGAAITTDQRGANRPPGGCDIGAFEYWPPAPRIDSIGIFRSGTFYLRLHNSTGFADITVGFNHGSKPYPVVGDWTGAGVDTVGALDQNNGLFMLCTANNTASCAQAVNQISFVLGNPNDIPLSGVWTAGFTHFGAGVFRPSNGLIYLKNNLTTGFADYTMVLGIPGDVGLAGDWNGDGLDSAGVYRASTQRFYLADQVCNCSPTANYTLQYGVSGDTPVIGDWIGQGHDGVGLFRQSNGFTYLRNSLTTGYADNAFTYGIVSDIPVVGHWQLTYPPRPNPGSVLVPPTAAPASTAKAPPGDGVGD